MPLDLSFNTQYWDDWSAAPHLHVHFWIKRTGAASTTHYIVGKYPQLLPTKNGWVLTLNATQMIFELWTSDASAGSVTAAWTPALGAWHCIDAYFNGTWLVLYADRASLGDYLFVGGGKVLEAQTDGVMYLGGPTGYPGEIEGLAIWNGVKSSAQQTILYNGGRRIARAEVRLITTTYLEALLELRHDARDHSGNGRHIPTLDSYITYGGGPFTRTLGNAGGVGGAYCPPIRQLQERACPHIDLVETTGH